MIESVMLYYRELSPSVRYALVTGLFLLISGIAFLFLFLSKNAELQSLRLQVKEVEGNIVNGKELQARCELPTEDEKSVWYEVRDEYYEKIPQEKKVLGLVKEIAKTALDSSIYDISFSMSTVPGDATGFTAQASTAASVPAGMADAVFDAPDHELTSDNEVIDIPRSQFAIKTSFHCNYRDLAHFLEALSRLPRMLELATLSIERRVPLMEVEMTLNAFYVEGMEDA